MFFESRLMQYSHRFVAAAKVGVIHLLISGGVALLAALVVFVLWFPYPYRELAGGVSLFLVLVGADVVCGPLLTLVLYSPKKSRRELSLDMSLVALVQVSALLYGMYNISLARPIALVYEMDRFVLVTALDIDRRMPWVNSPNVVGIRTAKDSEEALQSLTLSLQGNEPSSRPGWWQSYEASRRSIQLSMRPARLLWGGAAPSEQLILEASVKKTGLSLGQISYLPLVSQRSLDGWIVLLDREASIIGYAPVSGWVDESM